MKRRVSAHSVPYATFPSPHRVGAKNWESASYRKTSTIHDQHNTVSEQVCSCCFYYYVTWYLSSLVSVLEKIYDFFHSSWFLTSRLTRFILNETYRCVLLSYYGIKNYKDLEQNWCRGSVESLFLTSFKLPRINIGFSTTNWRKLCIVVLSYDNHTLHKKKIGFIDGSISRPTNYNSMSLLAWGRNNSIVISWILNYVSHKISASHIYMFSVWHMKRS